jgi:hypothetical protein
MRNGDISNETSPKIVVVVDVVGTIGSEEVTKGFLRKETIQKVKAINLQNVSQLWFLANKYGLSIELAAFTNEGWTQEMLEQVMEKLERKVSNPFNYAEVYADIDELVSYLPYRANLKGVVDIRERVARYGSYGVELNNL